MAQCVYCDKTSALNTSLTVKLKDGSSITVDICDEHAEEASVKTAREAHLAKQQKIDEILAQAKALGLNIGESNGGLIVAEKAESKPPQSPAPQPPAPQPPAPQPSPIDKMDGDDIVDTSLIDGRAGLQSIGGATEHGQVASHQSHVVAGQEDILPAEALEGKAKMELVEGREGVPLAIPATRVDGTGTTHIKVLKSDDQQLQSRFKKMADDSIQGKPPDFAREGYSNTTVNCGMCRGLGKVTNLGQEIECPKCKGAGLLSTY